MSNKYTPLTEAMWYLLNHANRFFDNQEHKTIFPLNLYWGWNRSLNCPLAANNKEQFNDYYEAITTWKIFAGERKTMPHPIHFLSKPDLADHLHEDCWLYICGDSRSELSHLVIDIDGKHKGNKPDKVLAVLLNLLPDGIYYEPSPSGRGYHIHLLVAVPPDHRLPWKPSANDIINRLVKAFNIHLTAMLGINHGFDKILGHYPTLTFDKVRMDDKELKSYPQVQTLGTPAMLPRLRRGYTNDDAPALLEERSYDFYHKYVADHLYDPRMMNLATWITAPTMTWKQMTNMLMKLERANKKGPADQGNGDNSSPGTPSQTLGGYTCNTVSITACPATTLQYNSFCDSHPCINQPDGHIHKLGVYSLYRRQAGERRSLEGYIAYYHDGGHVRNYTKSDKNRLRELARAWNWGEDHYQQTKGRFDPVKYAFVDYERHVERLFLHDRRIPPELVKVIVFLAEHPENTGFHNGFTVSQARMKAFCRRLNERGVLARKYTNESVLAAAKALACAMGWVMQIDDYQHGRTKKGVATKLVPGQAHPRFREWWAEYGPQARAAMGRIRAMKEARGKGRKTSRTAG